ncbi:hypothetical protein MUY27_05735 [Mucilaginibacter sp. RS28]|uniref:Uncharacterized protein n=1 Tax=Mucilaginibacter straminoryzae TaxID=2932774 RepID=A0A9X1X126_9SPHI|nr:hypothetical protein [Mucilaginibacter straminoryzae]MCJ8209199.1 hypothetical protein [Mucilaginibacter straminoryzae]
MSIQKALNVIDRLKTDTKLSGSLRTFDDLLTVLEKEQVEISKEALHKGFLLDWKMRWIKSTSDLGK